MIEARHYRLSPAAIEDLIGIFDFIAQDNPDAALRFVRAIEAKIKSAAAAGYTGVARDWLAPGLRALPYRDRCIYLRVYDTRIVVIRILHGRQDLSPDDFTESET
ncbi:type II toxin-antitoxin system RelE/ParE family toxin [Rhizobium sp. TRM96647]|uniref:type II toxin-antitoxin system RelE/ParE family toxin n=1 Tax=unclassified Rhizobium TaxID=2613769 RepID=UPI001E472552|nr:MULTISPECIES: type II toxin-antitoxin system RelE/ParE family toxin [unclassified Rhizobium]MCD2181146.1 type II toxin-antitoxin system RelE/ParE family toxin [Rhizobium sp. GN54]MCV3738458.1 type II toxin-antitoxin system RelE/ParE family toxin [Rhizobium sp. TRM96647]MCV3760145.1 type II toxin-antitoxin system RelE/ParE family toxin [Rhizobium sp. TRM96650]